MHVLYMSIISLPMWKTYNILAHLWKIIFLVLSIQELLHEIKWLGKFCNIIVIIELSPLQKKESWFWCYFVAETDQIKYYWTKTLIY